MRYLAIVLCMLALLLVAQSRDTSTAVFEDFGWAVMRGSTAPVTGSYATVNGVHKFGRHSDVDAADVPADVYDCATIGGPQDYQFSASAETYYVSSSNAGNIEAFTIQGLDADYETQEETVTLAGTSPVTLTGTWTRVNRAFAAGPSSIAGNVFIHTDSSPTGGIPDLSTQFRSCVQGAINQTLQAIYTIPSDRIGIVTQVCLGVSSSGTAAEVARFNVQARRPGGTFRTMRMAGVMTTGAGQMCFTPTLPQQLPGQTDIRVRVFDVASNNTDVYATFDVVEWPQQ